MKYLKKFNEALSQDELLKIERVFSNHFPYHRKHFTINPEDGTIDITNKEANVTFHDSSGTKLPVKFGNVPDEFYIIRCEELKTLEGSPHTTGFFKVLGTKITDLTGGPNSVELYSLVQNDKLVSLKGLAERIDHLYISDCPIKSLEGCPSIIYGDFQISNTKLTNLVGGPKEIEGPFFIEGHTITSLDGFPNKIEFSEIKCPNVWDPSPFRNLKIEELVIHAPISYLIAFFYSMDEFCHLNENQFGPTAAWDKFRESLDYNYVRQRGGNWEIIHFRFLEALAELDVTPNDLNDYLKFQTSLGPYKFVDEEGDYVNLLGDKLPQG